MEDIKETEQVKESSLVKKIIIGLLLVFTLLLLGGASGTPYKKTCIVDKIPEAVVKIEEKIYTEVDKQKLDEQYKPYIVALVSQESGGKGTDPFQASESKCGSVGCIKDVDESIEAGVKAFKGRVNYVKQKQVTPSPELILQMYNFGNGYLDWLILKNLNHSEESAKSYSKDMCGKAGTTPGTGVNEDKSSCYGDYKYVEHVSKYLDCTAEEGFDSSAGFGYPYKVKYYITQKFGNYNSMYSNGRHLGIDLDAGSGAELIAVADGEITRMANDSTGYGSHVYLKVKKDLYVVYGHMINGSIRFQKGSKVKKGQVIGKQGNTGFSTGSHLHLEFRKDDIGIQSFNLVVDPNKYIDLKKKAK